jgi:2-polyprenyl-3-methyl-5-hydroxy-6-metoxy-1,4-benzoquinol methylase
MMVFTNPRPTVDSIGYYYPSDYAPHLPPALFQSTPNRASEKIKAQLLRFLNYLNENFDKRHNLVPMQNRPLLLSGRKGRLLDVGAGNGAFLDIMRERGWEVFGVETNTNAVCTAKSAFGIGLFHGTLEQANFSADYFDAITMWYYLEHIHNPGEALDICRRILKPDGVLVLSVPDFDCFERRLFGSLWTEQPRHLIQFTRQTLVKMFEKRGFAVRGISHDINNMGLRHCMKYWVSSLGLHGDIVTNSRFIYGVCFLASIVFAKLRHSALMIAVAARKDSGFNGEKKQTRE